MFLVAGNVFYPENLQAGQYPARKGDCKQQDVLMRPKVHLQRRWPGFVLKVIFACAFRGWFLRSPVASSLLDLFLKTSHNCLLWHITLRLIHEVGLLSAGVG
jgi:hypothetical protein